MWKILGCPTSRDGNKLAHSQAERRGKLILGLSYHVLSFPQAGSAVSLSLFEGDPFQEAHQEHSGPRPSGLRSRKAPLVSSQGSLSDLLAQRRLQTRFFVRVGCGHRTARMASSNTVLRPRCVKAEHSRYFTESVGRKAVVAMGGRQWGYPGFCSLC